MSVFILKRIMKRMTVFITTLVIGLSWAAAETKQRAATDEASRPASADTLMKAPVDLSQVSMTNPVKALADRVRGHVNSQPLRFPNQHWPGLSQDAASRGQGCQCSG
jgi:hypothetical protein